MSASLDKLRQWMDSKEDEHLEFKEAKNSYEFEELVKYCVAPANEGDGSMVLGVTNKPQIHQSGFCHKTLSQNGWSRRYIKDLWPFLFDKSFCFGAILDVKGANYAT